MKHLNIQVIGQVQGVFYRSHTRDKSHELGISGYVMNRLDGSVFIEAEGEATELQKLVEWCREGSPRAQVDQVEVEEGELVGYKGFEIRYGS